MASGEVLATVPEARARRTGDERRALMISATADLLLERGFGGTKTRDVTDRCGVGTGLLNHYFTWSELRAHAFAEIYAAVVADQFRAGVPALQLIDGYLRTCFIPEAVPFLRLWLEATELAATDRLLADELDRAQRAFLAGLTGLLHRLNREEAWGLPDPAATALRLSAMQDGFAGLVLWGYPGLDAATAEAHLRRMLDLERQAGRQG
ncbi:TetR/AcrR family transcriptional regulator [Pannonibacter tanglangensis]|uniref:TetR family transcriptional regulator n=1 Tax=Pannonibacter tanglangensis TaxID=2750084 RepID=A0ABW9ZJH3_9HYPH|nr:TetR family transcriptional regulator C-terminal domain-containing protein [Pannonibacter sp. XCT-34]NBN64198.1 TetR family transcriptional regulator [Pannonibacter sp. XCT-34]